MDVIEKTGNRLVLRESQTNFLVGVAIFAFFAAILIYFMFFMSPLGLDSPVQLLITAVTLVIMGNHVFNKARIKITVDKVTNKIIVADERLLGKKDEECGYTINGLEAVEVEETETRTGRGGRSTEYDINLVQSSKETGGSSDVTEKETIYTEDEEADAEKTGKAIAEFAGLKYLKKGREQDTEEDE